MEVKMSSRIGTLKELRPVLRLLVVMISSPLILYLFLFRKKYVFKIKATIVVKTIGYQSRQPPSSGDPLLHRRGWRLMDSNKKRLNARFRGSSAWIIADADGMSNVTRRRERDRDLPDGSRQLGKYVGGPMISNRTTLKNYEFESMT